MHDEFRIQPDSNALSTKIISMLIIEIIEIKFTTNIYWFYDENDKIYE